MHATRSLAFLPGLVALVACLFASGDARAATPPASRGLAVLAEGDTAGPAATLARVVYADPGLLPPALDEVRARVLVGGPVAADAPADVRDLAETRAAIHGDDAPSRSLLTGLAASLHVKGLVVVLDRPGERPVARVFVAGSGAFDAVLYEPDPPPVATWGAGATTVTWSSTGAALHRGFAEAIVAVPALTPGPAGALEATPPPPLVGEKTPGAGRPFYASPWFWGAIGAALFAGAAFYFATRDSSDPNIQLSVQVPR
jgi:hypothetical protein